MESKGAAPQICLKLAHWFKGAAPYRTAQEDITISGNTKHILHFEEFMDFCSKLSNSVEFVHTPWDEIGERIDNFYKEIIAYRVFDKIYILRSKTGFCLFLFWRKNSRVLTCLRLASMTCYSFAFVVHKVSFKYFSLAFFNEDWMVNIIPIASTHKDICDRNFKLHLFSKQIAIKTIFSSKV